MDTPTHTDQADLITEKVQLPWSKPEIQRLTVSFDTANTLGSGADLETHGVETTT